MTSIRPVVPVLLAALVAAAIFLSCGGDEKEPPAPSTPPSATPTEAAKPSGSTEPIGESGDKVSVAGQLRVEIELPDNYPSDAPIYPGASPSQTSQNAKGRVTVMFGSDDSPEQVMDYMVKTLPDNGWTLLLQQEMPTGLVLQGTKDNRVINVLLSNIDEGKDSAITMIAVSVDS